MTSAADDVLELEVTGIAHGGTFIARHEGRVVFVSDAIPGERVRARLLDPAVGSGADSRRFWRAETVDVLDASPHRRVHIWPEADVSRAPEQRPGGADLGHIALDHQRVLKRQVLTEALHKFAGAELEAPQVQAVGDDDGTGWRTRVTVHVAADGSIGPFAARSHRVIPVSSYPLARPAIADAALALTDREPGRFDLIEPADGRVRAIPRPEKPGRSARGRRPHPRIAQARMPEPEVVHERVGDRTFQLDVGGFWQVHPQAASTLDAAVRRLLADRVDPDTTHLDLYGGVGLFASSLAGLGAEDIITVESERRATAHAVANLAPLEVTGVTARVNRFLADLPAGTRTGAVVLDPPRAGAGREVVDALDALDPEAIVYVACDPVAFARDLGTFREHGWQTASLEAFDLFPHSHHFEVVALLTR